MNTPVTDEYALDQLREALKAGDYQGAEKWKICLQGNVEVRIKWKQRVRAIKEANLRVRLKKMYLTPTNTDKQ